jgi:Kef-type K+ transport system membrane component KefB
VSADSFVTHVAAAIAVVTFLAYVVGQLFSSLGQPQVIGQLFVGIALGPSLLERLPGHVTQTLFPTAIVPYLNATSQVAIVLFLFGVGYDLDLRLLRRQRKAVPSISASTFVVPMLLGISSAYVLAAWYRSAGEPRTAAVAFILFMGIVLSITAVPVLAGIVTERGIAATVPGVTAMASAALIDAVGWLSLAGVLVLATQSSSAHCPWVVTALLLASYVAVMLLAVRPAVKFWLQRPGSVLTNKVPMAVAIAMGSAWATAALGLHVIFGAFLAGLIMPRHPDGAPDTDVLQPVLDAGRLLLPLYFVASGLSVNIGALRGRDFELLGVLTLIAIAGKGGAGFMAARLSGMGRRDAAATGVLLNTRGLTELIALNVGLQAGIIHQRLYTILVLMALVTTAATGPALRLLRVEQVVPRAGRSLVPNSARPNR